MALVWIPVTEKVPPSYLWVRVQTSDVRFLSGEAKAKLMNGHWYTLEHGYISGVTHWAETTQPGKKGRKG